MYRSSFTALILLTTLSCGRVSDTPAPSAPDGAASSPAEAKAAGASGAQSASARDASEPALPASEQSKAPPAAEFGAHFSALSEPDRYFFSDNYISNETSYLQVASALATKAQKGGAYIGVGPEQNFSYIALTQPKVAYILDIRRGNSLLHLLYKAIFHSASNRAEFAARLIGREAKLTEEPNASLQQVLSDADSIAASAEEFERVHASLIKYIQTDLGVGLSPKDLETLKQTHTAFFKQRLALRFELHQKNGRSYPSLRELLLSTSKPSDQRKGADAQAADAGAADAQAADAQAAGAEATVGSFLASRERFEALKRMQAEHRIIPVVGDFAGDSALAKIGDELRAQGLAVSVFYTSNVEQYLMEPETWARWVRNIDALPSNESSLFVRAYLDQGRRHPAQQKGHRTATLTQTFDHFKWRQRKTGYKSFWQLVSDGQ